MLKITTLVKRNNKRYREDNQLDLDNALNLLK